MPEPTQPRRLPIGAEPAADAGVHFRLWPPRRRSVSVVIEAGRGADEAPIRLAPEGNGYFSGYGTQAAAGTRYRFVLDQEPQRYPDPASRFQPEGPHGPSEVVDPGRTVWTWLLGPCIDAWLKVDPGAKESARAFLQQLELQLHEACIGSISEIFDAEPPFTPRGCVAQAWSVAEVLRTLALTGR